MIYESHKDEQLPQLSKACDTDTTSRLIRHHFCDPKPTIATTIIIQPITISQFTTSSPDHTRPPVHAHTHPLPPRPAAPRIHVRLHRTPRATRAHPRVARAATRASLPADARARARGDSARVGGAQTGADGATNVRTHQCLCATRRLVRGTFRLSALHILLASIIASTRMLRLRAVSSATRRRRAARAQTPPRRGQPRRAHRCHCRNCARGRSGRRARHAASLPDAPRHVRAARAHSRDACVRAARRRQ